MTVIDINPTRAITILKRVYRYDNTDYETTHLQGAVGYKTDFLSDEQNQMLAEVNLVPNDFEEWTHESLLDGFLQIRQDSRLSLEFASSLFVKALSSHVPRYRQTLMSYCFARDLSSHSFVKSPTRSGCAMCGLPERVVEDRTHTLFTYYLGHSSNESPQHFLTELKEAVQFPKPELDREDYYSISELLHQIRKTYSTETPQKLEKRIRGLLPNTDKYKRYGILQTLAVVGVLPSRPELYKQGSEIVLPLGGWKGFCLDYDRAQEVFGPLLMIEY